MEKKQEKKETKQGDVKNLKKVNDGKIISIHETPHTITLGPEITMLMPEVHH